MKAHGVEHGAHRFALLLTQRPGRSRAEDQRQGPENGTPVERRTNHAQSRPACSSDPLCAETTPEQAFMSLHGAACHNCLFLPETSCERGNRYLDRTVLVPTMERAEFAFFRP